MARIKRNSAAELIESFGDVKKNITLTKADAETLKAFCESALSFVSDASSLSHKIKSECWATESHPVRKESNVLIGKAIRLKGMFENEK